jgi:hypothetical protein
MFHFLFLFKFLKQNMKISLFLVFLLLLSNWVNFNAALLF